MTKQNGDTWHWARLAIVALLFAGTPRAWSQAVEPVSAEGGLTRLPPVEARMQPLPFPHPSDGGILLTGYASAGEQPLLERLTALEDRVRRLEAEEVPAVEHAAEEGAEGWSGKTWVVGADKTLTARWDHGLHLESEAKDFYVKVGGRTQYDNSFFSNDPALTVSPAVGGIGPQPDSFQMRRGRLRVEGRAYENFEFAAEYDFVLNIAPAEPTAHVPTVAVPGVTDLWGTLTNLPRVGNFRFGVMKEPIGMEHLTSSRWLPFIERSFLMDAIFGPFNNGFTPGVMIFDTTGEESGTWAIGWFSAHNNAFGYGVGPESAVTGRRTWLPVYDEPSDGRYLLHLGLTASIRGADEGQTRLRSRGNIRSGPPGVLNPIYVDTGLMAASLLQFYGAELAFNAGSLTVQAEYTGALINDVFQPFEPPGVAIARGSPYFHGGYVQALWFLTGEHTPYNRKYAVYDRIIPNENFFIVRAARGQRSGSGAWQIGFRYDTLDLNANGINGGIVHGFTWGLNWYWNPNMKVQFNYDLTHRSRVDEVAPGFINGFGLRYAMDF